jgi:ribosomal protein L23
VTRTQNPSAAAEQSTQAVEKSYSVTVENIRVLNVKMIEVARFENRVTNRQAFYGAGAAR